MSANISILNKGILIQYDYCTGCHACEVACKKEKRLNPGEFGIKVFEYGPAKGREAKVDYFFLPSPTDHCDLCASRLMEAKLPACIHNCQAKVMEYGDLSALAAKMAEINKCVLFSPGDKY